MKVVCISVGKKHDSGIAEAVNDYTARVQRHGSFEWELLPPAKGRMSVEETKRTESAAIAAQLKNDNYVVLLDQSGLQLTSNGLADVLDELDVRSVKRVVFVVG